MYRRKQHIKQSRKWILIRWVKQSTVTWRHRRPGKRNMHLCKIAARRMSVLYSRWPLTLPGGTYSTVPDNCPVEVTALALQAYAILELHELEASRRIRDNAETGQKVLDQAMVVKNIFVWTVRQADGRNECKPQKSGTSSEWNHKPST